MKTIIISLFVISFISVNVLANEFCGKLTRVSSTPDELSSITIYNSEYQHLDSTKYNDKYITLGATKDSFDVIYSVLKRTGLNLNDYSPWGENINEKNVWICLKDFTDKIKKYTNNYGNTPSARASKYYRYAKKVNSLLIKLDNQVVFEGYTGSALDIITLQNRKSYLEKQIKILTDELTSVNSRLAELR